MGLLLGLDAGGVDIRKAEKLYKLEMVAWIGASCAEGVASERVGAEGVLLSLLCRFPQGFPKNDS